ncbi:MAG: hypothetical protein ACYC0X_17730 [Pirellulaceae bacterium]
MQIAHSTATLSHRCVILTMLLALVLAAQVPPARGVDKNPAVRNFDASAIVTPSGYHVEAVATKLDFPVDITFDESGNTYIALAGGHSYGTTPKQAPSAQIAQLMADGTLKTIYDKVVPIDAIRKEDSSAQMPEGIIPPVTGVTWHDGKLYVSHRSRYSVLNPKTGEFQTIINGLPCWGEFLNAKPIFDADGKLVFFVSTQGNSGVIDEHFMKVINIFQKPLAHDVPGEDVELAGKNFAVPIEDPETPDVRDTKMTGVFVPVGRMTKFGQMIGGKKICNGAFFRANSDGTGIERIAWGFRSCFGYRFAPDGRLVCTQNSANPMPPRGLWWDFESVYEVIGGHWYGWPDFFSGIPITDPRFDVHKAKNEFVLTPATHRRLLRDRDLPIQPLVRLPVHSAAQGMVFGRREFGLSPDTILVAEMGAIVHMFQGKGEPDGPKPPNDAPPDVDFEWPGFRVQQVDLETGEATDFLVNASRRPATASQPDRPQTGNGGGLERPLQLEWGPDGALYVVDFGIITVKPMGMKAHPRTGAIWRVTQDAADRAPSRE